MSAREGLLDCGQQQGTPRAAGLHCSLAAASSRRRAAVWTSGWRRAGHARPGATLPGRRGAPVFAVAFRVGARGFDVHDSDAGDKRSLDLRAIVLRVRPTVQSHGLPPKEAVFRKATRDALRLRGGRGVSFGRLASISSPPLPSPWGELFSDSSASYRSTAAQFDSRPPERPTG